MVVLRQTKASFHQGHLGKVVEDIFLGEDVKVNARKETNIKSPDTGKPLEWDVWIPNLKLIFEYQDDYHYITTWYAQRTLDAVLQADAYKQSKTRQQGQSLIIVPCWWDGTRESLEATVWFHRPDLCDTFELNETEEEDNEEVDPIPLNPPPNFFDENLVPDIGELMLASFPSNRTQIDSIMSDESIWWMGEKYDGVRCCWNPIMSTLKRFTRTGSALELPPAYISHFPPVFLDSEIWFGRGYFSESQKTLFGDMEDHVDMSYMRIVSFDIPSPNELENKIDFEKRYTSLLSQIKYDHPFIRIATRKWTETYKHIQEMLKLILENSSEGLIIQRPASPYVHGRSPLLLKLKATRADREAMVVSFKDSGFVLKLPEGTIFDVPSENNMCLEKIQIGDVVTLTYESYSKNAIPVNPVISHVRKDVNWEFVIRDYVKSGAPEISHPEVVPVKPQGYWVAEKGKNMRSLLLQYARSHNFDPFIAENWYPILANQRQELTKVVVHYQGSYIRALIDLFPEVQFEKTKFVQAPRNHWHDIQSRKDFFEDFAQQNGFDSLNATNWYSVDTSDVLSTKAGRGALGAYNNSLASALIHVYPNIGLKKEGFLVGIPWENEGERKQFLIDFAKRQGFNPLVPDHWYSVSAEQIRGEKRGGSLLMKYKGHLSKALIELFPEVSFDRSKFKAAHTYWVVTGNYRAYFMKFAKTNEFDPLIADNWYNITHNDIKLWQGKMESAYARQVGITQFIPTLISSFPDLKLELSKFRFTSAASFWAEEKNRRQVFCDFAIQTGLDPLLPETWYSLKIKDIESNQKIRTLLQHHKGVVTNALLELFPDIGLNIENFSKTTPTKYWSDQQNRRKFMEEFAKQQNFDPLVAENWYSCDLGKLWQLKGSQMFLRSYSGNFVKAVCSVFPEIGLEKSKFSKSTRKK